MHILVTSLCLEINIEKSMMIGSNPQGTICIYLKIADNDTVIYRNKNSSLCKIGTRTQPLSVKRIEDISLRSC